MLRALLPAAAMLALVIGTVAVWAVDYQRTFDDCEAYTSLPEQLRSERVNITAEWSWSHLDWVCVYRDPETGSVVERRSPPRDR